MPVGPVPPSTPTPGHATGAVADDVLGALRDAQDRRDAARDARDVPAQIRAARDCGAGRFALEQHKLARLLYDESAGLIDETGQCRELLPEVLGLAGRAAQRLKDGDGALARYRRAAAEAEAQHLGPQQLRWAGKEARTRLDMQDPEGRALLDAAIALGRRLRDEGEPVDGDLSELLGRLANEVAEHDPEAAEALWQEAFASLDRIPRGPFHVTAAANFGSFLHSRGKHALSETYLEESLEIARELDQPPSRVLPVTLQLAATFREHDPARAGDLLMAELDRHDNPGARHRLLNDAADHYFAGRAWAKMHAACGLLRDLRALGGTPYGRYDVEMRDSVACRGLCETEEALEALGRAGEYAREAGQPQALHAVRGQTAIVHADRGEFEQAAEFAGTLWDEGDRHRLTARTLVQALAGLEQLELAHAVRDACAQRGAAEADVAWMTAKLADAGDGDRAAAWYAYGLAGGREPEIEAEALTNLLALHAPGSTDHVEVARARLRLIDSTRGRVTDVFSEASWLAVTELARDFPAWVDEFVEAAVAAGRHEDACYELERSRSQLLIEVVSNRAVEWTGERDHVTMKASAEDERRRARYRLDGLVALGVGWAERRAAAERLDLLESMAVSAGGIIHVAPGHAGVAFPQGLDELLAGAALDPGERIVVLHVGARRTDAWAIDVARNIDHTTIPDVTRDDLRALHGDVLHAAEHVRGGLRDARPDAVPAPALDARLETLDRLLMAPLTVWLAELGTARAFLAGGTGLASLPLDRTAAVAKADLELALLPSTRLLGHARARRFPMPETFLIPDEEEARRWAAETMREVRGNVEVVLDPTRTLTFAPAEAAAVALACAAQDVHVVGPGDVQPEAVTGAARRADLLHVIAHGSFADRSPYRSGMDLGADVPWTVADVRTDLDAPAGRVAVLSGCETGRAAPNIVSEEVSLPAAFLAAGFAAVVGSRWAVDDRSTALLMGELHRRWHAGGVSIASALDGATAWLRQLDGKDAARLSDDPGGDDAGARPFAAAEHWAAFFVAGDGGITADGPDRRVP
jgi:CHAT domain-containing protein/tetratricopeptide (TPR) repeat protein